MADCLEALNPARLVDLINTGRVIRIEGYTTRESTLVFGGRSWWLHQVTFHHGSESRIDGTEYPLEVQFLHHDDGGKRATSQRSLVTMLRFFAHTVPSIA